MISTAKQMSESRLIGCALAVVGGGLDAYTYLCRGKVFANAETGNIVLLALRLSQGDWAGALSYLVPVLAFACGVVAAEVIRRRTTEEGLLHWRQYVVALEAALLCLVAFLPLGTMDMVANTTIAFICAMQVECFRKIHGNALATTMCTGNLRSGTELLFKGWKNQDAALFHRGLNYYLVILFFILGAILGSLLSGVLAGQTVLVFSGILLLVFLLMFCRPEQG